MLCFTVIVTPSVTRVFFRNETYCEGVLPFKYALCLSLKTKIQTKNVKSNNTYLPVYHIPKVPFNIFCFFAYF